MPDALTAQGRHSGNFRVVLAGGTRW